MSPVELAVRSCLERMVEIRCTGGTTEESSYYSALENPIDGLGALLRPGLQVTNLCSCSDRPSCTPIRANS